MNLKVLILGVNGFIGNILRGWDIRLVDGGSQRRSFTCID